MISPLSTLFAAGEPAGGAPVQDLVPAAIVAAVMTTAVLLVGFGHRAGRITILTRIAALAERVIPVPGWAALPVLLTLGPLGVAAFGFFWDVATHIDSGRDSGPFASHPDDREAGHLHDCARRAAALEAWRSETDEETEGDEDA